MSNTVRTFGCSTADECSKFDALLSDARNQYWFQLTPGKMLSTSQVNCSFSHALRIVQSSIIGEFCMDEQLSVGSEGCVAATVSLNDLVARNGC